MARIGFAMAITDRDNSVGAAIKCKGIQCFKSVMDDTAGADSVPVGDFSFDLREGARDRAVVRVNKPSRSFKIVTEVPTFGADMAVSVFVVYDVVTLTAQEQADLYLSGICG